MWKQKKLALLLCCTLILSLFPSSLAEDERPTAIRLNKASATIGIDSVNRVLELSIQAASYRSGTGPIPQAVNWTTSDPNMVAVAQGTDPSKCVVTATAASEGSCTVTARCGDASASCKVSVKGLFRAKTLKVSGTKTIKLGSDPTRNRIKLTAKITPVIASANDPFRELVNWKSLNKKVADVDEDGWVQALSPGKARIVCYLGDGSKKKVTVTISVVKLNPDSITLKDQTLPMLRNFSLDCALKPDNAFDQRVTWKSSDRFVAQVASDGIVRGLKPGKATITATTKTGGKTAKCVVTIVESIAPSQAPAPSVTPAPSGSTEPTATPSPTATPAPKYHVYAFGNGVYRPSTNLGTIASAIPDAESFAALYAAARFPDGRAEVKLLLNQTAAQMTAEFKAMRTADGIDSQSTTLIYYQGHADSSIAVDRHGALLGVDGGSLTVAALRELLDAVPGTVVLMLDCNFSGRYLDETAPTSGTKRAALKALAQTFRAEKYKVICGCGALEVALDTGNDVGQTSLMMQGIRAGLSEVKPAADADKNGLVTLTELHASVRTSVDSYLDAYNAKWGRKLEQTVLIWPAGDRTAVFAK